MMPDENVALSLSAHKASGGRCPVCMGSRVVRLPLHREITVAPLPADHVGLDTCSKTYSCPECSGHGGAPLDKVAVFSVEGSVRTDPRMPRNPDYIRAIERDIAHRIVEALLGAGCFVFDSLPPDNEWEPPQYRARLVVAPASAVDTIEQRISARQEEVAKQVAEEARDAIFLWNSYYTGNGGDIPKEQAARHVGMALRTVLERRSAMSRNAELRADIDKAEGRS